MGILTVCAQSFFNVKVLLANGAEVNAATYIGTTALIKAASRRHLQTVEVSI